MHHKYSGARVQLGILGATEAHEELWRTIDSTIAKALATLTNKKEAR